MPDDPEKVLQDLRQKIAADTPLGGSAPVQAG